MLSFTSRRLATVLAVILAPSSHGFVVVPRPATARAFRLYSTAANNEEVASMRAGDIKKELESYGISTKSFLEKSELIDALTQARADGLKPKEPTTTTTTNASTTETSTTTESSSTASSINREERLREELEKCNAMKAFELKKELQELGVSTTSFFEKSEFAKALAEARVDGVQNSSGNEEYAEYANVEVITDDSAGPRQKQSQRQSENSSSPFGGGGNPFGDAFGQNTPQGSNPFGAMGGMGGLADMLKNLGGVGGAAGGGDPFGGANPFAGGASPFGGGGGGGMGGMMGRAQEMMKNPKVMEIITKAQSNPKIMKAVQECMSNPAAMSKYQNDPEISSLLNELKKYM